MDAGSHRQRVAAAEAQWGLALSAADRDALVAVVPVIDRWRAIIASGLRDRPIAGDLVFPVAEPGVQGLTQEHAP